MRVDDDREDGRPGSAKERSASSATRLLVLSSLQGISPRRLLVSRGPRVRRPRASRRSGRAAPGAGGPGVRARTDPRRWRPRSPTAGRGSSRTAAPAIRASLEDLPDPPAWLFVRGTAVRAAGARVAIVGARSCSALGREVRARPRARLAGAGVHVVSGAAHGHRRGVARGALAVRGARSRSSARGSTSRYPRSNAALLDRILATGTIVSEYPPGVPAVPRHFPARNRIVAGLARALVVVEGAGKSGSLISVDHALDLGRDVFAVPGPVTSPLAEVPLALIREGATMIRGVDDLLDDLGITWSPHAPPAELPAQERLVFEALTTPVPADALAREAGLTLSDTLTALLGLELRGLVRGAAGRFERTLRPSEGGSRRAPCTAPERWYTERHARRTFGGSVPSDLPQSERRPDRRVRRPPGARAPPLARTPSTAYRRDLSQLATFLHRGPVVARRARRIRCLRRFLAQQHTLGYARASIARRVGAIHTFYRWAVADGTSSRRTRRSLLGRPKVVNRLPTVPASAGGGGARRGAARSRPASDSGRARGRAPRPRGARAPVRVGAPGERGRGPHARSGRPRPRPRAGARQGRQGARGADVGLRDRGGRRLPARTGAGVLAAPGTRTLFFNRRKKPVGRARHPIDGGTICRAVCCRAGGSRRTPCDTRSRRTCSKEEPTSERSRSCSATRAWRPRSGTPTCLARGCSRPTSEPTRGPDARAPKTTKAKTEGPQAGEDRQGRDEGRNAARATVGQAAVAARPPPPSTTSSTSSPDCGRSSRGEPARVEAPRDD